VSTSASKRTEGSVGQRERPVRLNWSIGGVNWRSLKERRRNGHVCPDLGQRKGWFRVPMKRHEGPNSAARTKSFREDRHEFSVG